MVMKTQLAVCWETTKLGSRVGTASTAKKTDVLELALQDGQRRRRRAPPRPWRSSWSESALPPRRLDTVLSTCPTLTHTLPPAPLRTWVGGCGGGGVPNPGGCVDNKGPSRCNLMRRNRRPTWPFTPHAWCIPQMNAGGYRK